MTTATTIQIDAYNTNLHGCKILCNGSFSSGRFPPIMEYVQQLREPFKKKILLTRTVFSFSKALPLQYDAVFQVKELADWSLALTYILHASKPCLVVAEDVDVPDAVWGKLNRTITFVHILATMCKSCKPYDAVFFAPVEESTSSAFSDYIFRQVQMLHRPSYTAKEHKEIINELRVAGAGIAWTRVQEQTVSGSLYWYDTVCFQGNEQISKKQLRELFIWLANQFQE